MQRGGGLGERSGRSEADGGRHGGDGCRTAFEDKGAETGSRVTTTGVNQDREEAAGKIRTEEMITGVEDEGEIRTEERKEICAGATLMATHTYTRNPESPLGNEIDLQQWNTLIFKGEHAENEYWCTSGRTTRTRKEQQRYLRSTGTY